MSKLPTHNVQVCCRFRPLNKKERKDEKNQPPPITFVDNASLKIFNPHRIDTQKDKKAIKKIVESNKPIQYNFDRLFSQSADQEEVYQYVGKPMIQEIMDGYNCTIFTYGQTSCLDPEQKVMMFDGSVKAAKDVRLGDKLMGDDSTPRNVLQLYSGNDQMYEISPQLGDSYIVSQNHLLTLRYLPQAYIRSYNNRYEVCYTKNGEYRSNIFVICGEKRKNVWDRAYLFLQSVKEESKLIDIPVNEYLQQTKDWKSLHKGVRVSVEFDEQNVEANPYFLGRWLCADPKQKIYQCIPSNYLINTREIRLKVLAGLIDGCGDYDESGQFHKITHKQKELSDDIIFLARSLGFSSYKKCTVIGHQDRDPEIHYHCFIIGDHLSDLLPLLRSQKDNAITPPQSESSIRLFQNKQINTIEFTVQNIGVGKYNGFMLDGNHRFVLNSFDVTHNSGKTHSMFGFDPESGQTGAWKKEKEMGIIPRAINDIFQYINNIDDEIEFTIKVSFLEIYLEKIRDLLSPEHTNLSVRETKDNDIYVDNLKEIYVSSFEEILAQIRKGQKYRVVAETKMNQYSSRSHSILILQITQHNLTKHNKTRSKLVLVDLAGSERVNKSGAQGLTLDQVKHINKSLLMLGNVINAITEKKPYIPYRDSKLTRLLQDSLGGNSKTCLLITCSPSWFNLSETVSTLNFGARAKKIENKPRVNKELTVSDYRRLMDEANNKIKELTERIRILEAEIEELLEQIKQRDHTEGTNESKQLQVDHQVIEQLREKVNELDKLLEQSRDREIELKEQIQQHNDDMELKKDEVIRLQSQLAESEVSIQKKNEEIMKVKDQANQQMIEKKKKELEMFEKNSQLDEMKNDRSKLEEKHNELLEQNDKLQEQYSKLSEQNEELKNSLSKTQTQLEHLSEEERMNRQRDLNIITTSNENAQKKIEEKYVMMQEKLEEKERKIQQETENIVQKYEKKFESLRHQYSDFSKQYKNLKDDLKAKMEENLALQMEKEHLELQLQERQLENKERLEEILLGQDKKNEQELTKLKRDLRSKADEIMRLRTETESAKQNYEQVKEDNRSLELQVKRLQNKINRGAISSSTIKEETIPLEKSENVGYGGFFESFEKIQNKISGSTRTEQSATNKNSTTSLENADSADGGSFFESSEKIQNRNNIKSPPYSTSRGSNFTRGDTKMLSPSTNKNSTTSLENADSADSGSFFESSEKIQNKNDIKSQPYDANTQSPTINESAKSVEKPDSISDGDLSESSVDSSMKIEFKTLQRNLKKMREYNLYIRGRERYYLQMIENRRQHIETLESSLEEASRILFTREQEHMATIGNLRSDVLRLTDILKEMGVPENILGLNRNKIIVPIKKKKKKK